tara:strand:+ start:3180 stop:3401 length:222 start_codon:yes stop_codon:yes gene_type:complete
MSRFIETIDNTIDGIVQGELIVIGTVFLIGVSLTMLGMTPTIGGWLLRVPLIFGGIGAMLIGFRMFYAHKKGY